jgi:hypothetical protein
MDPYPGPALRLPDIMVQWILLAFRPYEFVHPSGTSTVSTGSFWVRFSLSMNLDSVHYRTETSFIIDGCINRWRRVLLSCFDESRQRIGFVRPFPRKKGDRHDNASLEPTTLRVWPGHGSAIVVQSCAGMRLGTRDSLIVMKTVFGQ